MLGSLWQKMRRDSWARLAILLLFISIDVSADCGCSKSREPSGAAFLASPKDESVGRTTDFVDMVLVDGGEYSIGSDKPIIAEDGEHPERAVSLKAFYLDETEVSNEDFARFVEGTSYKTEAETLGDSFVLGSFVKNDETVKGAVQATPWWLSVGGATWQHPEGPGSDVSDRMDHPVLHVSWTDAKYYCEHHGKRLPTEAEWEVACKKSLGGSDFPWDDKVVPADAQKSANIWQGRFPEQNLKSDGFVGTAPVRAFGKLPGLPLWNMIGNVWEWTSDSWDTKHDRATPKDSPNKVKKGGSYMCHASYCYRYRCEARSENTLDTSAGNVGFRCAADA